MKQNQARFESFPWEMEILELEKLFDEIDDFLTNEQIKKNYLNQKDTMFTDNTLGDPKQLLLAGAQIFRRQMIVLLKTYLEQIIKDFSINVFIGKPEKMAKYLLLNEFQDVKSLEELKKILRESETTVLNELPKKATQKVMKDGSTIFKKIKEISNAKIKPRTKENLDKLNEIRTHIVHDASVEEISREFLYRSFESVRDLIVSFREVCAENNISDVEEPDETDDWE
jgi:hypothetical protein